MNEPARLSKVNKVSHRERMEAWLNRHAPYILFLLIILLCVLIIALLLTFVMHGGGNMTMTEANGYYYHLRDIV